MPQGQDERGVFGFVEIVQRDVSRPASGNHQFAQTILARSADERMARQHLDRIENDVERLARGARVLRSEEHEKPVEICARTLRECYRRHRFARSLRPRPPVARAA